MNRCPALTQRVEQREEARLRFGVSGLDRVDRNQGVRRERFGIHRDKGAGIGDV